MAKNLCECRSFYLRQRFRQRGRVAAGVPVAAPAGSPAGACQADGVATLLERGAGFTSERYRRAVAPSCDFSISRMPKYGSGYCQSFWACAGDGIDAAAAPMKTPNATHNKRGRRMALFLSKRV